MARWAKMAMAATALLALLAGPTAAQVPDPFARELARELARLDTIVAERGYARAAGPFAGGLSQGMTRTTPITLRAGGNYRIVGVCDRRCGDLDLRLYDPNSAVIVEDVLPDAVPVMGVRPALTGQYTIEVTMRRCTAAPCWYAFNVYAR